jgi:hypothetical protein
LIWPIPKLVRTSGIDVSVVQDTQFKVGVDVTVNVPVTVGVFVGVKVLVKIGPTDVGVTVPVGVLIKGVGKGVVRPTGGGA